ncbi:MAG TPA: alginate lyase family protein, partial [Verrucomicrobiae bacterium]
MKVKLFILGAIWLCTTLRLPAGTVSLFPGEIVQLRALIATNSAAATQFASIKRAADRALNATPDPIEKVVTEGHLDTDPLKIRTMQSLADMDKIENLTWTWTVMADDRYAAKARELILAWARVNQPDGDAINETRFEPVIVAYDLLRKTFSPGDQAMIENWLRHKAEVLWKDHRGLTENWFSHRLKIVGLIGWTLNDAALIEKTVTGFQRQINSNFKPDGASTDFYKRDAFHYHLYDVEPLLTLARVAERNGDHFFDYAATNGATLGSGVAFVVPYATGEKTHMEFVNSHVSFDQKRAKNGQGEYSPHQWNPHESIRMFSEAAWFRPEYGVLAAKLAGQPGENYFNW